MFNVFPNGFNRGPYTNIFQWVLGVNLTSGRVRGNGATALAMACLHGHRAVVRSLLQHRARPGQSDKKGRRLDFVYKTFLDAEVCCKLAEECLSPGPSATFGNVSLAVRLRSCT